MFETNCHFKYVFIESHNTEAGDQSFTLMWQLWKTSSLNSPIKRESVYAFLRHPGDDLWSRSDVNCVTRGLFKLKTIFTADDSDGNFWKHSTEVQEEVTETGRRRRRSQRPGLQDTSADSVLLLSFHDTVCDLSKHLEPRRRSSSSGFQIHPTWKHTSALRKVKHSHRVASTSCSVNPDCTMMRDSGDDMFMSLRYMPPLTPPKNRIL